VADILADKEMARRMGEAGLARAGQFSWSAIAGQVEDYYRELRDRYPRPRYGRERN
jgi:glycosyltransferase involved in cell wall biosynthesis